MSVLNYQEFAIAETHELRREALLAGLADLHTNPSVFTGRARSVRTVAAAARSVRAFCTWLVRQGFVEESPFPPGVVPKTPKRVPQLVGAKAFARLLEVCQSSEEHGRWNQGMAARNRAVLWLLMETGLPVSDLCGLRLSEVDTGAGILTVRGKGSVLRTFVLSADGMQAVKDYVEQTRLLPAWTPRKSEDQEILLLTAQRKPLTNKSLTLLFQRLNERAGLTKNPICPSMLRETSAIRFLQSGGELAALQEQLGVADLASVRRYEHFWEARQKRERRAQKRLEED